MNTPAAHTDDWQSATARLAGIVNIAEDAIIGINSAQQITMFNHGAEKMFGYTAADMIGQPLDTLLPARFHRVHHQHIRNFAEQREATRMMSERREIWGRRKNGEEFPAEASISKYAVGDEISFSVILRDVTERRRQAQALEQQVQQRTAHLHALLQFSGDLLTTRSADDVLQRLMQQGMALVPDAARGAIYLADGTNERLSLRASAGFDPLPTVAVSPTVGWIGRAFTQGEVVVAGSRSEWERLLVDEADHTWWHAASGTPPTGVALVPLMTHDRAIGVLVLLRDRGDGPFAPDACSTLRGLANIAATAIVEEQGRQTAATLAREVAQLEEHQRTLQERLNSVEAGMLQTARLAAVGQLAASVAHEINNPLYAARNGLYLIEDDLPPSVRQSPYWQMVGEQLGRIAGIIERMRDFYRPPRGELVPYDVNRLLEETLALAELNLRNGTVQIIFAPAPDLPRVECNGDQLRQVFLNLVLNAIDAMPDGGTLTVRTVAGPTLAIIEVEDTGIGIAPDVREHLFEPFWTDKPNGTGLGLSISAHIVTQHGGQIEVDSSPDHGATFRVVLPYQAQH